jgi:methyl-accepting chemotaxis protein
MRFWKSRARVESSEVGPKPRFRLSTKIILFVVAVLVPLAALTWTISVRAIRHSMSDEFTSKGTTIAASLASSAVDLILTRDASTVQALVDQFAAINGVAYVMVYDLDRTLIAHTFSPLVPTGIVDKNPVPGSVPKQVREITFPDPVTGDLREIIDIGVPMLGGQLGTVRVGMNKAFITAAAMQSGYYLLLAFAGGAVLAGLAGVVFARRITQPIAQLVAVARRVGQGNLTELVPVTSRDEIGQLAETFNQTIVRLRSQVHTEAERDQERRSREDLQRNITSFLHTVVEISAGDLTKRGDVTADVLGNVVDAINLMVAEIAAIIVGVRQAALRVASSASDMIGATGHTVLGAQAQTREVMIVSSAVEELTRSVRQVADMAEAAARAARQALEAAQKGDEAVRGTLEGIQRTRAEVQTIAKKIKSLGDRSLEISEIVTTIDEIAAQTNLLALNAAIEAAGAGEAGARFGIVADEVRRLAERSAKATRDIAALIKKVQGETQDAIAVVERGTQEVETGYRVTVQAGTSLAEIATVSQRSAELAQDISLATQRQVRGAEGVAVAVQSIAAVAVQTEQGAMESRKVVEELARVADELTVSLVRFKLTD